MASRYNDRRVRERRSETRAARLRASIRNDLNVLLALKPEVKAYRVAARAGIGPVVLSRALRGGRRIDAELALRVYAAILAEEAAV